MNVARLVGGVVVAALFPLAALGGARLGTALHGPLQAELRRTHWSGPGAPKQLTCNDGPPLEVRGESLDLSSGTAIDAFNGCSVSLVDTRIRAPVVLHVFNHSQVTLEGSELAGINQIFNESTVTIHGGSIDTLISINNTTLRLDDVRVRRLGVFNNVNLEIHGGELDELVLYNESTLVATDAEVRELDAHNDSQVTLHGGHYGLAYIWNGAKAQLHGSLVDRLETDPRGEVQTNDAKITQGPGKDGFLWVQLEHKHDWMDNAF